MCQAITVSHFELNESQIRTLIANLPSFAVLVDRERRFIWVNRLDPTLTMDQVLGTRVEDFSHPSSRATIIDNIDRAFREQIPVYYEARSYGTGALDEWFGTRVVPLGDTLGGRELALLVATNETARVGAEELVRRSRDQLEATLQAIPDLLFDVDEHGRILGYHAKRQEHLAVPPESFLGRTFHDVLPSAAADACLDAIQGAARDGHGVGPLYRLSMPDGEQWFEPSVARKVSSEAEGPRFVLLARDVTARKMAEGRIVESEERLRMALDASGQATWELDLETMTATYSPEHAEMLGYAAAELPGQRQAEFEESVHPADRARISAAFGAHLRGETAKCHAEFRIRTTGGAWKWLHASGKVTERADDGRPRRMIGTHMDIDDRKAVELQLASSLAEKETLLREIHHRVKNNLQVILGLLHFQAKKLHSPEDVAALGELRQRIYAMTLVHERLYQSTDVTRVDLGPYLRALVAELRQSFVLHPGVRIVVAADDVRLPIELAMPTGMILSELVTNVLKYAFPGDRDGTATVSAQIADGRVVIAVDDDGVGFPDGFAPLGGRTFGWELVRTLVLQLDGTVETTTAGGAHVRISFAAPGVTEA